MIEKIDLDLTHLEKEDFEKAAEDLGFTSISEFFTACASTLIIEADTDINVAVWLEMLKNILSDIRTARKTFFKIIEENAFDELAEFGVKHVQLKKLPKLSKKFAETTGVEISDYILMNWIKEFARANYAEIIRHRIFQIEKWGVNQ